MLTFGEELKRLAEENGFRTQKSLADASGVSQQTVAALYLNKSPNVSYVIVQKLCAALGVPCDHFKGFIGDEAKPAKAKRKPKGK